jgi:tyrosyl-tRNA synthetase
MKEAKNAALSFEALFHNKDYTQAREFVVSQDTAKHIWIVDLLKIVGVAQTSSQVKRLVEGNAVFLDDIRITDFKSMVTWKSGSILKAGKVAIFKLVS